MKKEKVKKHGSLQKGVLLLAVSGFIGKFLGAFYRVPLTNILGAEGIGLYQLVFPIYSLLLVLSSGAIPAVTARLVAESNAKGRFDDGKGVFHVAFILLAIGGIAAAAALFLLADKIAAIQGNADAAGAYRAASPAIFVVALSSAFRGYFQGNMSLTPSALSNLTEQTVKMAAGLLLALYFKKDGVAAAAVGALYGVTLSEIASFFVMFFAYMRYARRIALGRLAGAASSVLPPAEGLLPIKRRLEFKHYTHDILRLSLPVLFAAMLFPLSNFVDSLLIVRLLLRAGMGSAAATSLYGLFTGSVNSLINMPVVLALAISVAAMPVVARGKAKLDVKDIKAKSTLCLKCCYAVGIPCVLGFVMLSSQIMRALYPGFSAEQLDMGAKLLSVSAVNILLLSLLQIYSSLLQALDKTRVTSGSLVAGILVKILVSLLLVPPLGIYGAAISTTACYLVSSIMQGAYFRYLTGKNQPLTKSTLSVCASALIMGGAIAAVAPLIKNVYLCAALTTAMAIVIYATLTLMLDVFDKSEIKSLPAGKAAGWARRRLRGILNDELL